MAPDAPKPPIFYISRRGFSYAVSVILITIIALSLLAIVFNFGNTFLQSQSRNPRVAVLDAGIVKIGSSVIVKYSVGNVGSEQITLKSVRVEGTVCSQLLSVSIPPGQKYFGSFLCGENLPIGNRYVLRVEAEAVGGEGLGDAVWVRVEV